MLAQAIGAQLTDVTCGAGTTHLATAQYPGVAPQPDAPGERAMATRCSGCCGCADPGRPVPGRARGAARAGGGRTGGETSVDEAMGQESEPES